MRAHISRSVSLGLHGSIKATTTLLQKADRGNDLKETEGERA